MDPRGTVGRIYKEDHYTLIHTKYERSGPSGFGEDDFYDFSIVCLWELITPGAGPFFYPRGIVGRIYKEDHYTLLHTKYENSGSCSFGDEDFFMLFPITPPRTLLHTKYESSGPYGFEEEDFFYVFPIVSL